MMAEDIPKAFDPPKKRLGQHFLHDYGVRRRIAESLEISGGDSVLEIGPGRGALTGLLDAAAPDLLVALERDPALARRLALEFPGADVVICDALKFVWERLDARRDWKLAGNLPYNVASPIMWEIFSRTSAWSRAVFMVQKEVGRRLIAAPGGKEYGALSVWIRSFARVEQLFTVGPGAFNPPPRVDSMVLRFEPAEKIGDFDPRALASLLRLAFSKRRKQLGTILKDRWTPEIEKWLHDQGFDRKARPENLNPIQFQSLSRLVFWGFRP
jgi:16S rRNA (adenine1518-N6/adenine1519-N6)-dimethyltransferase